jgi:hypothetical protein
MSNVQCPMSNVQCPVSISTACIFTSVLTIRHSPQTLSIVLMLSASLLPVPFLPRLTKKTPFLHYFRRVSNRVFHTHFAYSPIRAYIADSRAHTHVCGACAKLRVHTRVAYRVLRHAFFACRFLRDERIGSAYIRTRHARAYEPRHACFHTRPSTHTRVYFARVCRVIPQIRVKSCHIMQHRLVGPMAHALGRGIGCARLQDLTTPVQRSPRQSICMPSS